MRRSAQLRSHGQGLNLLRSICESKRSGLLEIALLSVAKCRAHTESHDAKRWNQENNHALAKCPLRFLRSSLCRAVAHGASLAEYR
jgi:hypothetical protein